MIQESFDESLQLLGEILEKSGSFPQWLIVCGGSSLQAQEIIHRATRDIDVLATRSELSGLEPAYPFPDDFKRAIQQVADLYALEANWLNCATSLFQLDLQAYPSFFWLDQKTVEYGTHLKISYLSPRGLTLLKTLAVLQRDATRDLEDLIALAPDLETIRESLDWCFHHAVDQKLPVIEHKTKNLLVALNHETLISNYYSS